MNQRARHVEIRTVVWPLLSDLRAWLRRDVARLVQEALRGVVHYDPGTTTPASAGAQSIQVTIDPSAPGYINRFGATAGFLESAGAFYRARGGERISRLVVSKRGGEEMTPLSIRAEVTDELFATVYAVSAYCVVPSGQNLREIPLNIPLAKNQIVVLYFQSGTAIMDITFDVSW